MVQEKSIGSHGNWYVHFHWPLSLFIFFILFFPHSLWFGRVKRVVVSGVGFADGWDG